MKSDKKIQLFENRSSLFISLLGSQDILVDFLRLEKMLRGKGNSEEVLIIADLILRKNPKWDEFVIFCANYISSDLSLESALNFIDKNLNNANNKFYLERAKFYLLFKNDSRLAFDYVLKNKPLKNFVDAKSAEILADLIIEFNSSELFQFYKKAILLLFYKNKMLPNNLFSFINWSSMNLHDGLNFWKNFVEGDGKNHKFFIENKNSIEIILYKNINSALCCSDFEKIAQTGLDSMPIVGDLLVSTKNSEFHNLLSKIECKNDYLHRYFQINSIAVNFKKKFKEKKIALCFSGQARDMQTAHPEISYLINTLGDVDLFFALWKKNGVRLPTYGSFSNAKRILPDLIHDSVINSFSNGQQFIERYPSVIDYFESINNVSEANVLDLYPSAKSVSLYDDVFIDDNFIKNNFGALFLSDRNRNQLRMYYLINEVIKQALSFKNYDLIIRLRPDALIEIDITKIKNWFSNFDFDRDFVFVDKMQGKQTISDSFALGNTKSMYIYSSLFEMIKFYGDKNFNYVGFSAHVVLYQHLRSFGINVEEIGGLKINGFSSPVIPLEKLKYLVSKDRNGIADNLFEKNLLQLSTRT